MGERGGKFVHFLVEELTESEVSEVRREVIDRLVEASSTDKSEAEERGRKVIDGVIE